MVKSQGNITAPSSLNIQEHEISTARAMTDAGYDVEFVRRTWGSRVTSADVVINGVLWEMKSPQAGSKKTIERNLRRASKQSSNIHFDSQRIKGMNDSEIESALRTLCPHIKAIKRLRFVNRNREIIDIK